MDLVVFLAIGEENDGEYICDDFAEIERLGRRRGFIVKRRRYL